MDEKVAQEKVKTLGIDLFFNHSTDGWRLISPRDNKLELAFIETELWDTLAPSAVQTLIAKEGNRFPVVPAGEIAWLLRSLPVPYPEQVTLAFRTADGTSGLLRILECLDNPARMKLQIKVVEPGTSRASISEFIQLPPVTIPNANQYIKILSGAIIEDHVTDVYQAQASDGTVCGYYFQATGTGFSGPLQLKIAVDATFDKYLDCQVVTKNEVPGWKEKIEESLFLDQFKGALVKPLDLKFSSDAQLDDGDIVAVTGATVSCEAVVNTINTFTLDLKRQLKEAGIFEKKIKLTKESH